MDLKGIAWAGNIYQKFEAMCLEVEEVMYQDTVKYLENQVETVGSSVKKFYSEVIQDILPPAYVDPVKVAAADLPLNPYSHTEVIKKPKQPIKQFPVNDKIKKSEDCKGIGDINAKHTEAFGELHSAIQHAHGDMGIRVCSNSCSGNRKVSGLYRRPSVSGKVNCKSDAQFKLTESTDPALGDYSKASSFCRISKNDVVPLASVEVYDSRETMNIRPSHVVDNNVCTSTAQFDSPASRSNLSNDAAQVLSLANSLTSTDTEAGSKLSAQTDPNIGTRCGSALEGVIMTCEGRSDDSTLDAVRNHIELEIIERLEESKFEDTCVLVEGNELQVPLQKKGKSKSYKKKIQEAFPLKMKSRKQEYEKLATQYRAQASKPEEMDRSKSIQAQGMPESEWELL